MVALKYLVLLLLLVGCGVNMDYALERAQKVDKTGGEIVFSTLDSDGELLSMYKNNGKITVLIFSAKYCTDCQAETREFIASLEDPEVAPSKINMITLMINGNVAVADWFKSKYSIPWTVGIDGDNSLVMQYCGMILVPCVVVQHPEDGIIFSHIGIVTSDELKELTGEWE